MKVLKFIFFTSAAFIGGMVLASRTKKENITKIPLVGPLITGEAKPADNVISK